MNPRTVINAILVDYGKKVVRAVYNGDIYASQPHEDMVRKLHDIANGVEIDSLMPKSLPPPANVPMLHEEPKFADSKLTDKVADANETSDELAGDMSGVDGDSFTKAIDSAPVSTPAPKHKGRK